MTDLDIRIALAEVRGMSGPWVKISFGVDELCEPCEPYYLSGKNQRLPELTLDWLHEIEHKLCESEPIGYKYEAHLMVVTKSLEEGLANYMRLWHATTHQRAEAILRVLGKWREE